MIELPKDYVSFLLTNNGGTFHDTVMSNLDDTVTTFYALQADYEFWRLGRVKSQHLLESKLLPIANTLRGDPVCISVDSESLGHVLVYDSIDLGGSSDPEWHKLANSFTEFYESLHTNFQWCNRTRKSKTWCSWQSLRTINAYSTNIWTMDFRLTTRFQRKDAIDVCRYAFTH